MTAESGDGRATLRDVAQAQKETREEVQGLRDEFNDQISQVKDKLDEIKDGLLPRVSVLETVQASHQARLDGHETRLTTLEGAHLRALGHLGAIKVLGGVVGGAGAIVLGDLLVHWIGG